MRKSTIQRLALMLLVIFMTNLGVWSVSSSRQLAHELEHEGHLELAMASHQHAHFHHANDIDDDDAPGVIEHQMLHAVDHLQLFPDTALNGTFVPSLASIAPIPFPEQLLPLSSFDPPFRPPRSGVLPA